MMAPHQESDDRNTEAGAGHEAVTEHALAGETGDDFADHSHTRQDHDVDGGVRIKPEHVLEQDGVAAERRIEDAHAEGAFESDQRQRYSHHWSAQYLDQRGGVVSPHE